MKKNYLIALLALFVNFANAQFIESTTYRGAFAPTGPMWTDSWANFDPINEPYLDAATVVNVTTDITASTTWTTGKTYKLTGLIYVRNNAVLTIQPGVVIKGLSSVNGTALIITKGSKLNAIGTAANPIVFTSGKTVLQGRQPGDWGGIILLGRAGFNAGTGTNNIEGITANVNTEYGGGASPINNDDSGTLKYVRIEFGGYVFSPNNEINGLTMGSVGNGTTIDYVQVSYTNDDAFEWFGGSVNCKHLVSFRNLDDDFDTDNGYKGIVQFGLIVRDPSIADNPTVSTSEGFESDNNAAGTASGSGQDTTSAIFTNITAIGPSYRATLAPTTTVAAGHERSLRLRRATQLKVFNSIFMDFKQNLLFVDGTLAVANANAGTLKFKNNIIAGPVNPAFPNGVNPTSLNGWISSTGPTGNNNTVQASSSGLLTSAYDDVTTPSNTYLGLDYRPIGIAASGADFNDSTLTGLVIPPVPGTTPSVTNLTYCKGVVAPQLTATITGSGTSLLWYTVLTGGTGSATAPTPLTSTVGVKNYYVSQLNPGSVTLTNPLGESTRVLLTVTTLASPTEVISTITGVGPVGSTSATAIGNYVGTTSQFVYSVASFSDTSLSYLWTVPLGVNIVSGQGTNALTVNFANVAFGAGAVGSIQVQAVNANGCRTLAKTLALTKALPAAPGAINMYDTASLTPLTALTSYAKYMGSTTPLTLTASTVAGVNSYEWELPAGVNLETQGVTPVRTNLTYTAIPFFSPTSAPTAIGTKFWVVATDTYNVTVNGVPTVVTKSTATQKIAGNPDRYRFTLTSPAAAVIPVGTAFTFNGNTYFVRVELALNATAFECTGSGNSLPTATNASLSGTLTNAVNPAATLNFTGLTYSQVTTGVGVTTSAPYLQYGTVVTSNLPSILVNFQGVTNAGTTALYVGVRSKNGVGYSTTPNTTNVDVLANLTGIPGLFTTTYSEATTPPTSSSPGTSIYTPSGFAPKTSKLKKLIAAIPLAPAALKLTNPAAVLPALPTSAISDITRYIGTTTPLTLTATPSATAISYSWELPAGVTQVSGGTTNVIEINFADFDPADLDTGIFATYLGCKAVNLIGSSITNNSAPTVIPATLSTAKLLKVTATRPAAPTTLVLTNGVTTTAITNVTSYIGTSTPLTLTAAASVLATSYSWELPAGATQLSGGNDRIITINLAGVVQSPSTLKLDFGVKAVNRIGSSITLNSALTSPTTTSTAKILRVTNTVPAAVTIVTGTTTAINCGITYNYTITPSVLASSYIITGPTGSVVTSASTASNTTNSITTSDLVFSVVYPSNLATVTPKTVVITSVNGFGTSATNKTLTIAPATIGALGVATTGGTTFTRCANKTISIPSLATATNYTWTVADGAVIVSGQGTTSIVVDFTLVPLASTTNAITVIANNNCGVNTLPKIVTLTSTTCIASKNEVTITAIDEATAFSNVSIYPNPATFEFSIDIDAAKVDNVQMSIYAINGVMVMNSKTINLEEGSNTINENISNLKNGIYIVRLVDSSNNEVMVKKLIKN